MTDFAKIELLVLDVDGVLTDGSIIVNSDGTESKTFNTHDGHAIRMWQRAGFKAAFLSGRDSVPTKVRADQLEIEYVFQNCHYKMPVLEKLVEELGLSAEQVAYVGDDMMDIQPIRYAGFGVAVANATAEAKSYADYVTKAPGGSGAVREVIELILKENGKWDELLKRYVE
ncbi:MAG: HAD hydrolase family protein [Phycisphaerae bacterium]|nr:HAD hydrolase family protein [Phycisphaerae bacterium]